MLSFCYHSLSLQFYVGKKRKFFFYVFHILWGQKSQKCKIVKKTCKNLAKKNDNKNLQESCKKILQMVTK